MRLRRWISGCRRRARRREGLAHYGASDHRMTNGLAIGLSDVLIQVVLVRV